MTTPRKYLKFRASSPWTTKHTSVLLEGIDIVRLLLKKNGKQDIPLIEVGLLMMNTVL